ncbi:MAG: peptidylprolyl isomerase [Pseudomonadota bacterium]
MFLQRSSRANLLCAVLLTGLFVPSMALAEDDPVVELRTALGTIVVELYPDRAPITVANFLRYVDGGHYDGASFYRTVRYANDRGSPKIEVIQGGLGDVVVFDPIAHEDTVQTGLTHSDGVISMARGAVGTASSEFFIVIGDQPGLDKGQRRNADGQGFAAFGRVVDGMAVIRAIHTSPSNAPSDNDYTQGQIIEAPVVIESAKRRADSAGAP